MVLVAGIVGDACGVVPQAAKNAARQESRQIHAARRAEVHGILCREMEKSTICTSLNKGTPMSTVQ